MKILAENSIEEVKPKKIFDFKGHKFAVVSFPLTYMEGKEIIFIDKVVHYSSGKALPLSSRHHRQTLKSYVEQSLKCIDNIFNSFGAEKFEEEINNFEKIN